VRRGRRGRRERRRRRGRALLEVWLEVDEDGLGMDRLLK